MSLIDDLTSTSTNNDFHNESFKYTLEAHLPYLRKSGKTTYKYVTDLQTVVYRGNLFGLLNELRVPKYMHWIVMRLNGFYSSFDYTAATTSLMIPDVGELEQLRMSWKTSQKVNA